MQPWVMWVIGVGVVVAALVLMAVFNGGDLADSRGRRTNRAWRAPRIRPVPGPTTSPHDAPGTGGEEDTAVDDRADLHEPTSGEPAAPKS